MQTHFAGPPFFFQQRELKSVFLACVKVTNLHQCGFGPAGVGSGATMATNIQMTPLVDDTYFSFNPGGGAETEAEKAAREEKERKVCM